jgi:CheY-like chemotaxis protein
MDFENEKVKILVIDDADIIRSSLKKFLQEYDLDVITCSDGLEGLQKAIEHKPKLIFLDLLMPNLDGIRLLRVMKVMEELKYIPTIVISGHTDKINVLAAMEAGAERIISKPFTKEILVKNINEVLGNNFLSSTKKFANLTSLEKEQMSKELRRYFVNSLASKQETIRQSVINKNIELLKLIVHELKGSSGTVGFSQISESCKEIEKILLSSDNSWTEVEDKCSQLIENLHNAELTIPK